MRKSDDYKNQDNLEESQNEHHTIHILKPKPLIN